MEIKKIVEGMTATTVAKIIDENFKGLSNEKADVNEVNKIQAEVNNAVNIANNAKSTAEQAVGTANIAKEAIKTLEGLANTTTAQETLASQVVQIEENKQNIAANKVDADTKLTDLASESLKIGAFEDALCGAYKSVPLIHGAISGGVDDNSNDKFLKTSYIPLIKGMNYIFDIASTINHNEHTAYYLYKDETFLVSGSLIKSHQSHTVFVIPNDKMNLGANRIRFRIGFDEDMTGKESKASLTYKYEDTIIGYNAINKILHHTNNKLEILKGNCVGATISLSDDGLPKLYLYSSGRLTSSFVDIYNYNLYIQPTERRFSVWLYDKDKNLLKNQPYITLSTDERMIDNVDNSVSFVRIVFDTTEKKAENDESLIELRFLPFMPSVIGCYESLYGKPTAFVGTPSIELGYRPVYKASRATTDFIQPPFSIKVKEGYQMMWVRKFKYIKNEFVLDSEVSFLTTFEAMAENNAYYRITFCRKSEEEIDSYTFKDNEDIIEHFSNSISFIGKENKYIENGIVQSAQLNKSDFLNFGVVIATDDFYYIPTQKRVVYIIKDARKAALLRMNKCNVGYKWTVHQWISKSPFKSIDSIGVKNGDYLIDNKGWNESDGEVSISPNANIIVLMFAKDIGNAIEDPDITVEEVMENCDFCFSYNDYYTYSITEKNIGEKVRVKSDGCNLRPHRTCLTWIYGHNKTVEEYGSHQGFAVYKDYAFVFHSATNIMRVFDIRTGVLMSSFVLNSVGHVNQLQFGEKVTDTGFPYLYVSGKISGESNTKRIEVLKVTKSSCELERTVDLGSESMEFIQAMFDFSRETMYVFSFDDYFGGICRIAKYNIQGLESSTLPTYTPVFEYSKDIEYIGVIQGGCFVDDMVCMLTSAWEDMESSVHFYSSDDFRKLGTCAWNKVYNSEHQGLVPYDINGHCGLLTGGWYYENTLLKSWMNFIY